MLHDRLQPALESAVQPALHRVTVYPGCIRRSTKLAFGERPGSRMHCPRSPSKIYFISSAHERLNSTSIWISSPCQCHLPLAHSSSDDDGACGIPSTERSDMLRARRSCGHFDFPRTAGCVICGVGNYRMAFFQSRSAFRWLHRWLPRLLPRWLHTKANQ